MFLRDRASVARQAHNLEAGRFNSSSRNHFLPKVCMARDPMLIEFLKKESALTALIMLLTKFEICGHISRPMRIPKDKIYISTNDIKVFCDRWVKTHREQ